MSENYLCIKSLYGIREYHCGLVYEIHEPETLNNGDDEKWMKVETDLLTYTGGGMIKESCLDEYFSKIEQLKEKGE